MANPPTPPKGRPTASKRARRATAAATAQRDRRWRVAIVAGLGVAVVAVLAFLAVRDTQSSGTGTTDATAFDLPALDEGGRVTLSDFRGQPVIVNFFASWCTQCDAELPEFRDAARALDGEVQFVFVNSNEDGDWRPMAERNDILEFPIAKDVHGTNGNGLYRAVGGASGMPITAFYDAEGNVVDVAFGALLGGSLDDRLESLYGVQAPAA